MKTWHFENAVVAAVLLAVWVATGHTPVELVGSAAVLFGFCCASITDRLTEKEAARARPSVSCYRLFWNFFIAKEACWACYFAWKGAWSALVGVGIFMVYPFWRKFWRKIHPMARETSDETIDDMINKAEAAEKDEREKLIASGVAPTRLDAIRAQMSDTCPNCREPYVNIGHPLRPGVIMQRVCGCKVEVGTGAPGTTIIKIVPPSGEPS